MPRRPLGVRLLKDSGNMFFDTGFGGGEIGDLRIQDLTRSLRLGARLSRVDAVIVIAFSVTPEHR